MQAHLENEAISPALCMRSVRFAYESDERSRLELFEEFDFTVNHDEWVAVIGPSGCGKSTLAKLATGIELPDEGKICVLGAAPREVYSSRQLGVAFQDSNLVPWLTIRRNIELPAMGMGGTMSLREAAHALTSAFRIENRLDSLPAELSGGMAVRVSLARALIHNPRFVVLDEPFASLDEITAIEVARHLLRWRRISACALLLISHDLEAVARLADRCLCFPARSADNFTEIDLRAFGPPEDRSPEAISRIRLLLLEKYL